jgi:hypothetical protein
MTLLTFTGTGLLTVLEINGKNHNILTLFWFGQQRGKNGDS